MSSVQSLPYNTPQVPKTLGTVHWPTLSKGLIMLFLANVVGTQFIAYRFNYARALGKPIARLGSNGVYLPSEWAFWFLHYTKSQVPYVKNTVAIGLFIIAAACLLTFIFVIATNSRRSRQLMEGGEDLHGSARFQTRGKPRLTVEEFQKFAAQLGDCERTIALVCICFALRISECLGLKWHDMDWLGGKLCVERGGPKEFLFAPDVLSVQVCDSVRRNKPVSAGSPVQSEGGADVAAGV